MDALEALGDSTRRRVVELLATGEMAASEIAAHFPTSRNAVSQHLHLLREAGLVSVRPEGTRRIYALERNALLDVERWLRQRLDALDTELKRGRREQRAAQ